MAQRTQKQISLEKHVQILRKAAEKDEALSSRLLKEADKIEGQVRSVNTVVTADYFKRPTEKDKS
jgi:hypothetical protein